LRPAPCYYRLVTSWVLACSAAGLVRLLTEQTMLPTVHEVLHADWHETAHSVQPACCTVAWSRGAARVRMCLDTGKPSNRLEYLIV